MARAFVHLHVHSHWSLLAGAMAPAEIARRAAAMGMPAVAMTDTDALHGVVPFAKACAAAGVKPIVGMELTDPRRPRRAVFLAREPDGYPDLCELVSARRLDPDFDLTRAVATRPERLAVVTRDHRLLEAAVAAGRGRGTHAEVRPAPAGDHPTAVAERALRRETLDWAARLRLPLVATTGAYYLEPARRAAHKVLRAIGTNSTVAALDARAAEGARAPGDLETGPCAPETAWLMPGHAVAAAFADCPAAIEGAGRLAAGCRFELPPRVFHFPTYPTGNGESAFAVLWREAFQGLARRYRPLPTEAIRRLQEELDVIEEKGFADYFLVIRDIAEWARERHIPSVGRGSAANSLVSFCLGITHVDPLKHRLYFERFLSRERAQPPDFDLDFCWRRRDDVIGYVYERFGEDRVAMIATFCRLGARGALRETARALGIPDGEISKVTKRVPHFASVETLLELRHALPECRGLPLETPPWDEVVARALEIDMYPRHIAVHPGGIVIGPERLERWVPRQMASKGVLVTQFDMHPVEDVGLVKIDLLGNRGLSAIADVADLLREEEGMEIEWAVDEDAEEPAGDPPGGGSRGRPGPPGGVLPAVRHVNPFRDSATRALMRSGRTMGCFYIESPSMRALLRKLRCDTFEMLTAASSIIRPGIADSGMMDAFVRRFHGQEPVEYLHPVMEQLLGDTYGVMIYQEDVMKVVHRLAGMTLGEADGMRRSMSHKGGASLEAWERKFLDGARANGVDGAVAREIWRQIVSFAGYSFCKAHSASYAQVSFRSAWLKVHRPAAFMASVLANGGGYYPAFAYVEEARRMGLEIRLPDVNRSGPTWRAEGEPRGMRAEGEGWRAELPPGGGPADARAIRAGIGQVGEVEARTVAAILAERRGGGSFASLSDFCARVAIGVPEIHRLIDAGAFDAFDLTRPQAKWKAELLLRGWGSVAERAAAAGRAAGAAGAVGGAAGRVAEPGPSLFPPAEWRDLRAEAPPAPALADYPAAERRRREWEALGVSPAHHPLGFWRERVGAVREAAAAGARGSGRGGSGPGSRAAATPPILARDIGAHRNERVEMIGFLVTTKRVRTKRDEPMMFLTLEDETDIFDVVLFPRVYQRWGDRLIDRGPYVVTGRVEDDPHPSSVTAERLQRLEEA